MNFLNFHSVLGLPAPGSEGCGGVLQCWLLRLVIAGTWSEALLLCSWSWYTVKGWSHYKSVTATGKDKHSALFRLGGRSYWISLLGLLQNRLTSLGSLKNLPFPILLWANSMLGGGKTSRGSKEISNTFVRTTKCKWPLRGFLHRHSMFQKCC